MRIVNKTISLERFKSRLPGVLPAYEGETLYYFDKTFMLATHYLHRSNYGLFPVNVLLSGATIDTIDGISYIKATNGWDNCTMAKIEQSELPSDVVCLSYERISNIYAFFRNYYTLINEKSGCGLAYSSATEFFDTESTVGSTSSFYNGWDRNVYEDMDVNFHRYGGEITTTIDAEGNIVRSIDAGLFNWICKNIVPTFHIPTEYIDEYKSHFLYFPDVLYWCGWLVKCGKLYDDLDSCSASTNCCECEEYLRRGGSSMRQLMEDWITSINAVIEQNNAIIKYNIDGGVKQQFPFITDWVSIQNSTCSNGEMTPMVTEFESGIDYTPSNEHKLDDSIDGGTIVVKDNVAYLVKSACKGYKYDDRFCEKVFGNDISQTYEGNNKYSTDDDIHWLDYMNECLTYSGTSQLFKTVYSSYTYNVSDKLVYNPTPSHIDIVKKYPIDNNNANGYIWYNDLLLEIQNLECVMHQTGNPYVDGAYYEVFRDYLTNTPYINYNGRTLYATMDENCQYSFSINSTAKFERRNVNPDNVKPFVKIGNESMFLVVDGQVVIPSNDYQYIYPKVDGFFIYNNESTHYVKNGQIVTFTSDVSDSVIRYTTVEDTSMWVNCVLSAMTTEDLTETNKLYYEINTTVNVTKPYKLYYANYVTGQTSSQLTNFLPNVLSYDDIGNILDGYYDVDNTSQNAIYSQPTEGTMLTPYYNVGNTANVTKLYTSDDGVEYYIGDIITKMTFYYKNLNGTVNTNTIQEVTSPTDGILEQIQLAKNKAENIEFLDDTLHCQFQYLIGATLYKDGDLWKVYTDAHLGVEYTEDTTFIESQEMYYLNTDNGYLVKYYLIGQNFQNLYSYLYNKEYTEAVADFKMQILTFNDALDGDIFTKEKGFSVYNNQTSIPVFKQEYKVGSAIPSSINSNITVDRGIATAFDKHLKLGEVASFEALENYGNGFFSIVTD